MRRGDEHPYRPAVMSKTDGVLRQAVVGDIDAMHRVRLSVRENRLASTITAEDYARAIDVTGRGWVVERDGEVVAFAVGNAQTGNIWALFVDPRHERQGFGRALHDTMVAWLFSRGLPRLSLGTEPKTRAYRFYVEAGWTETGALANGEAGLELAARDAGSRHPMQLVRPKQAHLPSYVAALERGWSADNLRGEAAAREELAQIAADPGTFLATMEDREGKGPPVKLPDGSLVPRLPGFRRWLWDGEFAGSIGMRWQPGTTALPPHCLGHIGYAVVPWKQGRGYGTIALRLMLVEAKSIGLPHVEITTDPDNLASRRVIEANGGKLVERFVKPAQFDSKPGLRFRIDLE